MADSGSKLLTLAPVEVVTPGTAVRIPTSSASVAAKSVIIQALSTNTEGVMIGDSSVKAKAGAHGSAEAQGIELAAKATIAIDVNDSTAIYVDARTAKDGVAVTVLLA
jgi:hypothetical protein